VLQGGVAALAALFLMPDASKYGMRNGFFSFHWNLLVSPTTGYALGTALLAVVFLHRWVATRSQIAFAWSAALVGATFLFRAHVFILLFPAWVAVVAIASHTVQQRRILFLVLAGALAIGAALALRFAPHLPPGVSWVFDEGSCARAISSHGPSRSGAHGVPGSLPADPERIRRERWIYGGRSTRVSRMPRASC
jgi:hypothetical protein